MHNTCNRFYAITQRNEFLEARLQEIEDSQKGEAKKHLAALEKKGNELFYAKTQRDEARSKVKKLNAKLKDKDPTQPMTRKQRTAYEAQLTEQLNESARTDVKQIKGSGKGGGNAAEVEDPGQPPAAVDEPHSPVSSAFVASKDSDKKPSTTYSASSSSSESDTDTANTANTPKPATDQGASSLQGIDS